MEDVLVELIELDEVAVDAVYVPLVEVVVAVEAAVDGRSGSVVETGEFDFLV